ncbi:MAG: hypothetical protein R3E97_04460 [Candidatus Eisenbacteria bacterium]
MRDDDLFRKEALEEFATSRTRGRLLQISPAWSSWVFWLLLFTLVTGFAFIALVPVDRFATGVAGVIAANEVATLFRPADREGIEVGQPLLLIPEDGTAPVACRISAVGSGVLGPEALRAQLGASADRLLSAWNEAKPSSGADGAILVRASLLGDAPAATTGLVGRAEVRVGRETLLRALAPGDGR